MYYIALLNILFFKIYVQKLTCCSWKLGFRGIIFSARKLQECRILHHLPQSFLGPWAATRPPTVRPPLRGGSTRLLNRFEYTSFWGSYAPDLHCPHIKSEISSDVLFILYNIYLFTFVFKICLFILVPVMCNLFPKRENSIFEIE